MSRAVHARNARASLRPRDRCPLDPNCGTEVVGLATLDAVDDGRVVRAPDRGHPRARCRGRALATDRRRGRGDVVAAPPPPLRGYFDAGFQSKTRVHYVAGYVGTPDHWKAFNRKWRALLRRNNLPHFHMTDYMAGKNRYYRDWSAAKRNAVMERILSLAVESDHPSGARRFGIAAALSLDDYERLSAEDRKLIPEPYGICLTACLSKAAR